MASKNKYSITGDGLTGGLPVWTATSSRFPTAPSRPNSFNGAFSSDKFAPVLKEESASKNQVSNVSTYRPQQGGGSSYASYSMSYNPKDYGYDLDLSAFNAAREKAIASANRSKELLKSQYDRLLSELNRQRKDGNEQFGRGRSTIAEDAYDRNRANLNNLASRGLAGSGLQQLGEVQERMETGNQMNDLASQYYSFMDDLNEQQKAGEDQYNQGIASIEASLEDQLANLGLQEFQAQNQYNQYMSNLAMQLADMQSRDAARSISAGRASNELNKIQGLQNGLETYKYLINNGAFGEPGSEDYESAQTKFANLLYDFGKLGGDVTQHMGIYDRAKDDEDIIPFGKSPISIEKQTVPAGTSIFNRYK